MNSETSSIIETISEVAVGSRKQNDVGLIFQTDGSFVKVALKPA
jgi:hypothetical protein